MIAEIVIAVAAVLTLLITILVQRSYAARAEGALTQRVANAEKDIDDLKEVDRMQWGKIAEHGEKIAALEVRRTH